jgi:hypothetical protein
MPRVHNLMAAQRRGLYPNAPGETLTIRLGNIERDGVERQQLDRLESVRLQLMYRHLMIRQVLVDPRLARKVVRANHALKRLRRRRRHTPAFNLGALGAFAWIQGAQLAGMLGPSRKRS